MSAYSAIPKHTATYTPITTPSGTWRCKPALEPWIEHRTKFHRVSSVSLAGRDVCFTLILRKIKSLTHFSWQRRPIITCGLRWLCAFFPHNFLSRLRGLPPLANFVYCRQRLAEVLVMTYPGLWGDPLVV